MTHQRRIEEIASMKLNYNTMIGQLHASQHADHTDLRRTEEALAMIRGIRSHLKAIQKRCEVIFDMTLKECGLQEKVGLWRIEVETDPETFLRSATEYGHRNHVRFALCTSAHHSWKGSMKECPLYKATPIPMSIPVEWLDMPLKDIKARIQ